MAEAVQFYNEALALEPIDAALYLARSTCLSVLGRAREALGGMVEAFAVEVDEDLRIGVDRLGDDAAAPLATAADTDRFAVVHAAAVALAAVTAAAPAVCQAVMSAGIRR